MITVENLSLQYGGQVLFSNVDLQFTAGNCYGIIGANGAGKSTFLKILSGEIDSTGGHVYVDPKARMSVLKQNQGMYDAYTVLDTVIMGNPRLYECGKEKDAIYEKADFTDEDGIRASELEEEFAELGSRSRSCSPRRSSASRTSSCSTSPRTTLTSKASSGLRTSSWTTRAPYS